MWRKHKILKSFCLLFFVICSPSNSSEKKDVEILFDEYYQTWKTHVNKNLNPSSSTRAYTNTKEYKNLVNLGIPALPYFFSAMKQEDRNLFGKCLWRTIMKFTKKEFDEAIVNKTMVFEKTMFYQWIRWWEKDRKNVDREFNHLYSLWRTASLESEEEQLLHKIENLGLPALPCAIEKIKKDGADLIEAVNYWTDDALKNSAGKAGVPQEKMREYSLQWWRQNQDRWRLPPVKDQTKQ